MITVFEFERLIPKYYGLCGLESERALYVHSWDPFYYNDYTRTLQNIELAGFRCVKQRDFPTKLKTSGFIRRID